MKFVDNSNIYCFEGTSDINLALNKVATYCGKVVVSSKVVDGDKSLENTERIIGGCDEYSYIDVQLGAAYYIHYVVVYEGMPVDHSKQSKINYSDNSVRFAVYFNLVLQFVLTSHRRLYVDKFDIIITNWGEKRTVCMI